MSARIVIEGGTIVTMDRDRRVLRGNLLIEDGRIARIGRFRVPSGATRIQAKGCAVIPGLVQAHVHLCQALFRGAADDKPLLPWLRERIWPLESGHDPKSLKASARLGLAEMLLNGTTTILDMGTTHHHDTVFEAMAESGIRGASGKAMMDAGKGVPKGLRESTRNSLRESDRLRDAWHRTEDDRLRYAYAPRFILSCSEKLFRAVSERAEDGVLMHTHAAEHADERKAVKEVLGEDDIAALERWGITGPSAVFAHCVQLRASEVRRLAKRGTRIAHCPSANLKLASGIANVPALRDAGIVVGIGADGAPCNNRMDPWTELRSAALLAKVRAQNAAALPASAAFEMATIDGARALGWDDDIGSLELGKKADVVVLRVDELHQEPAGNVYSRLVYATRGSDVKDVLVDGRVVVSSGELQTLDEDKVKRDARRELTKVFERAGL